MKKRSILFRLAALWLALVCFAVTALGRKLPVIRKLI